MVEEDPRTSDRRILHAHGEPGIMISIKQWYKMSYGIEGSADFKGSRGGSGGVISRVVVIRRENPLDPVA